MSYSWQHWKGCMCDACTATFHSHNPSAPNVIQCGCKGCQDRYNEKQRSIMRDQIARTIPATQKGEHTMSAVHFCEREGCGAFFKGKALGAITLVLNADSHGDGDVIRQELCPACVKDIHDVLTMEPVTPRERSYSKPYNPDADETKMGDVNELNDEQLAAVLFERMMSKARKEIGGSDA